MSNKSNSNDLKNRVATNAGGNSEDDISHQDEEDADMAMKMVKQRLRMNQHENERLVQEQEGASEILEEKIAKKVPPVVAASDKLALNKQDECGGKEPPQFQRAPVVSTSLPGAYACGNTTNNQSQEEQDEELGIDVSSQGPEDDVENSLTLGGDTEATTESNLDSSTLLIEARLAPSRNAVPAAPSGPPSSDNGDGTNQILSDQETEPVIEGVKAPQTQSNLAPLAGILLLLIIIVLLILGLSGVFSSSDAVGNDSDGIQEPGVSLTRMQRIQKAGLLRCGYHTDPGVIYYDENGVLQGFDATMCRIIAAAMDVQPRFVEMQDGQRFPEITSDVYDVLIRGVTHNMERSTHESMTQKGIQFSIPYLYEGVKLAGDPFYIHECADKNLKHTEECSGIRICVWGPDTTHYESMAKILPQRFLVPTSYESGISPLVGLVNGTCNVQGNGIVSEHHAKAAGWEGPYAVGQATYSKDPLAIVTHSEYDPEFSDFVQSILRALLVAENYNITQETAHDKFPLTSVFGDQYKDAFQKAVAVEGHFGVLYEKYWEQHIPRGSLNYLNNGTTGLLYSHPLGNVLHEREAGRPLGPRLQTVLDRGFVRCGIRPARPGFVTATAGGYYAGMDVDFCRALAASLYQSNDTAVEFVELTNATDSFVQLSSGSVDVVTGATLTLENDVREPTTGEGFAFSQPYFYGHSQEEDNFCLATKQDDHDWAMFVYWTVAATIIAEEQGINQTVSNRMPEVLLWGKDLNRCFRDPILMVGSYADIYERNLEPLVPRGGRNQLNAYPNLGPQHYIVPGFL